ncbi:molybdenum ABC transporter ATP-binding protein [Marinomonas gallaica]|uniref:molybdenum ABC transporter ATP-binding protein n=1 Tax=Marinomonas gallaica TaxID=1806667 RepID=UPI003A908BBA
MVAADQHAIHAAFKLSRSHASGEPFTLDVDIQLPSSGVTAVFGHSGSGKTTFLRCVAGLERAQAGQLTVQGEVWQKENCHVPTHQRPIGYVFQEASLFEHLTGMDNLAFAMKRAPTPTSDEGLQQIIELMGIESVLTRLPKHMSGGERQRVAIARALLIQPRLLLMDEPLASLDHQRKQEILPYLARLRASLKIPILYVSHSVDEIAQLADHVVVLEQGTVVAQGDIGEVFARTDLNALSGFDTGAVWQGKSVARDEQWHLVKVSFQQTELWVRDTGEALGSSIRVRILARDVSLARTALDETSILNRMPATITDICPDRDEAMILVRLDCGEEVLIARLTKRSLDKMALQVGQEVWAQIKSVAIVR